MPSTETYPQAKPPSLSSPLRGMRVVRVVFLCRKRTSNSPHEGNEGSFSRGGMWPPVIRKKIDFFVPPAPLRWNGDPQRRQRIQMVLLRESGMTQPAIAEAMGVSLSTVNMVPANHTSVPKTIHSDVRRPPPKTSQFDKLWKRYHKTARAAPLLRGFTNSPWTRGAPDVGMSLRKTAIWSISDSRPTTASEGWLSLRLILCAGRTILHRPQCACSRSDRPRRQCLWSNWSA